ncbi:hypothetical protein COCNU_03G006600 [Cocos nucifera]|uniref:Uncharacterized protein n=1 Tax=Cocos nucifera TaxID=13894 RepID=A0A8K0MZ23_COCNU|nr:hypothetical protein COCNU_03G006600 [Cocos nucifera]
MPLLIAEDTLPVALMEDEDEASLIEAEFKAPLAKAEVLSIADPPLSAIDPVLPTKDAALPTADLALLTEVAAFPIADPTLATIDSALPYIDLALLAAKPALSVAAPIDQALCIARLPAAPLSVSIPGPRWRLQRPQELRNGAVPAKSKSLKLRRCALLGAVCLRRWCPPSSDASDAAARSASENTVTLVDRRIGGRRRFPGSIFRLRRAALSSRSSPFAGFGERRSNEGRRG